MRTEEEIVQETYEDLNRGKKVGQQLVYDKKTQSVRSKSALDDPDSVIEYTPEHLKWGSDNKSDTSRIIISGEILKELEREGGESNVFFRSWDNGDVYNLLTEQRALNSVPGTLHFSTRASPPVERIGKPNDVVRVVCREKSHTKPSQSRIETWGSNVSGYLKHGNRWSPARVSIIPIKEDLYSRNNGIIESNKLSDKRVAVVGLGSHGCKPVLELGKLGIRTIFLFDDDRFEVGNISRHIASIPHVGRKKVNIFKQLLQEINPYLEVHTFDQKVNWDNSDKFADLFANVDLCICTTGENESMLVTNRLCVEHKITCIFAGALRRAHAVQIIRVRPWESLCYQCFRMLMPEEALEHEIANGTRAQEIAYSDKPGPIEPGLSTDIAPVSSMIVKLAIQELLKGCETTLSSLDEDLIAPWYLWINRREPETQFENIEPLGYNLDGFHILRWYGIDIKPDPECPVCGNFEQSLAERAGVCLH